MKRSLKIGIATLLVVLTAMGVASAQSVTRDLPDDSVDTGANFNVTIDSTASAIGMDIKETIPSGFSYVSHTSTGADSVNFSQSGNKFRFTVTDIAGNGFTITYTLKSADTADTYTFSGTYKPMGQSVSDIGGDTQLSVTAPSETQTPTEEKPTATPTQTTPTPTQTTPATETPPPATPTPGFEAIFAVAGLLAVAYLLRRR